MKKLVYTLAAIMTLGLAACSDDEVIVERNNSNVVNFAVATPGASRAADVYCNNNKPGEFTVHAEQTGTSSVYMDADLIKFQDNAWTNTTATRYWPAEGTLDFYAYTNDGGSYADKAFGTADSKYAVDSDVASQQDLLYAVTLAQGKETNGGIVPLNFRHALSQIVFKAKNTSSNMYISITGVKVNAVAGEGVYTFPAVSTDDNIDHVADGIGADAEYYASNRGAWSDLGTTDQDYAITFDAVNIDKKSVSNGDAVNISDITTAADVASTPAQFTNAMILIPQDRPALNLKDQMDGTATQSNDGAYFTLTCDIYNVAGDAYTDGDVKLYSGDIRIPANISWQEGKKYVYTFVFGDGDGGFDPHDPKPVLVPISFEVSVDEFVPVTGEDLDYNLDTSK